MHSQGELLPQGENPGSNIPGVENGAIVPYMTGRGLAPRQQGFEYDLVRFGVPKLDRGHFALIGQCQFHIEWREKCCIAASDDRKAEAFVASDLDAVVHRIEDILQFQEAVV